MYNITLEVGRSPLNRAVFHQVVYQGSRYAVEIRCSEDVSIEDCRKALLSCFPKCRILF